MLSLAGTDLVDRSSTRTLSLQLVPSAAEPELELAALDDSPVPGGRAALPLDPEDCTLLRVRLLGPGGRPVERWRLECFAGTSERPEFRDDAIHVVELVEGVSAEIVLPVRCFEALLIASAAEGPAVLHRVEHLRVVGGALQERGRIEVEVEIPLTRTPGVPMVTGSISVEGAPHLPDGLRIHLLHEPKATTSEAERLAREPRLAAVNPASRCYGVGPLTETAAALWVTANDVEPMWIPIEWEAGDGDLVLDLDCRSGIALHLSCFDAASGAPAAGVCLGTEVLVETERSSQQVVSRPHFSKVTTDGDGRCTLRGLPPGGRFRVTECGSQRLVQVGSMRVSLSGEPLLELRLALDSPRELWHELRLDAAPAGMAQVFGDGEQLGQIAASVAPESAERAAPVVVRHCLRDSFFARSGHGEARTSAGAWE